MNLRQLDAWLRLAADRLHDEATTLTQLDQAIGDGDHGINMDRGFSAVVAMLDAQATPNGDNSGQSVGGRLRQAGQTLIKTVGGASGPLYGTAFLRAAAVYSRVESPSITDTVTAMQAAAEGIGALGRSTTGEKTMLDALVPAATAAQAALDAGHDDRAVLAAAREAAEAGAQATVPMRDKGPSVVSRRAQHRPPGPRSEIRRAARQRAGRCARPRIGRG